MVIALSFSATPPLMVVAHSAFRFPEDRPLARTPLPRTPNRLDPIEGVRAFDEQVLAMIVSLTSEVAVLRARLDAAERLLVASGALAPGAVDGFDPAPDAAAARDAERQALIRKVFRPLTEAAASEAPQ